MSHATRNVWAAGLSVFAGTMLAVVGLFQLLEGLSAVLDDDVYVTTRDYVYQLDITTWGWIHVVVGLIGLLIGVFIVLGRTVALMAGIALAAVSAVTNFLFLPWYPWWSLIVIAIDVMVIWALSVQLSRTP
ncbi:DUF7144 family membrane protein [Luteipulveratus flavus]|uniref:DUF7144 domain-containing protein n=1 Tax=Luteipulveratus flavus TaxID=3031728 RepID=A0ABT6C264_9MICO|nr:hypothetical protein [Luteipulveratus sp. YIM 133296]MDF8262701.1 hypothetical protein [Luteipulveratus sp. YIM 133296]